MSAGVERSASHQAPEFCVVTKAWRSGAAWVAQMTVQAIADKGVAVGFIAPLAEPIGREPAGPTLTRMLTPREIVGPCSRGARLVASMRRVLAGWWCIAKARRQTRRFLFSIPDPLLFTLPLFAVLRLTGARITLLVHDAKPHAWNLGPRWRFLELGALALSYRLSTSLVALTPSVKKALIERHSIEPSRIAVIPHGPFVIDGVQPLPGSGRYLLFGTLRSNKGIRQVIDGVLEARRSGSRCQLVLAGEPHPSELPYWEDCRLAMEADPEGFDIRRGFYPDERLAELLDTVDCFVLVYTEFESQSGVGVLATLAGRPMIATRVGGLAELLNKGAAAVTIDGPLTGQAVRAAIDDFEGVSTDEWRARAASGAARLAESFRSDQIADAYIDWLRTH